MAVALLVLAGPLAAGENLVYRCKDAASGQLSFQSDPCGPGQVHERAYDATPERVTPDQDAANLRRNVARPKQPDTRRGGKPATRTSSRAGAVIGGNAACKRVRAARDKAYRKNPKMDYNARGKWGDRVRESCG